MVVAPTPNKTAKECVSRTSPVCTFIEAKPRIPKSISLEFIAQFATPLVLVLFSR